MKTLAFGALLMMASAVPALAGDDACIYRGTTYSEGATSCQAGKKFECDDGKWKATDKSCQDDASMKGTKGGCQFGGVAYSAGSDRCQDGMQYRCDDGEWKDLGTTCR